MWHVSSKISVVVLIYCALLALSAWCLPSYKPIEVTSFEEGLFVGALAWLFPITDIALSEKVPLTLFQEASCWFVGLSTFFGVILGAFITLLYFTATKAFHWLVPFPSFALELRKFGSPNKGG